MDAVSGVDERIFLAEFAGAGEVDGVACNMNECFGALDFCGGSFFFSGTEAIGKARVLEAGEERVEGFACVALVGINVAMRVDEHSIRV